MAPDRVGSGAGSSVVASVPPREGVLIRRLRPVQINVGCELETALDCPGVPKAGAKGLDRQAGELLELADDGLESQQPLPDGFRS